MVHLTRIYTRTGDDGTTALGDMSRVRKTDERLRAFADVDEANSAIGVALAIGGVSAQVSRTLLQVQNDLFDVGADLCTPVASGGGPSRLRVTDAYVDWLEVRIDEANAALAPLDSFILPGGSPAAALLHTARTVVRRAERSTWAAWYAHAETMNALPARYLNRLSDLLFVLARVENAATGDVRWQPGGDRQVPPPRGRGSSRH